MNGPDPMDETSVERRDPRRCSAHNRAGAPYGKFAMRGQAVLPVERRRVSPSEGQTRATRLRLQHPDRLAVDEQAEEIIEIAELRLRNFTPRAVDVLEHLRTAESESVALGAANSLTDRAVGKARERVEMAASIVVKRPW